MKAWHDDAGGEGPLARDGRRLALWHAASNSPPSSTTRWRNGARSSARRACRWMSADGGSPAAPRSPRPPCCWPRTPARKPGAPASRSASSSPAAAGGTTDIMGRLSAQHLQARWGTPVVVENRTGAGGTIGTLEAMRAKPDGLTLLSGNIGPQAIAYSLFRNLPYNAGADHPDRRADPRPQRAGGQRQHAGPQHGRIRRMAALQPGADQLRLDRRRAIDAPHARLAAAAAERGGDPRALPRLRPGADRAAGRQCRLHDRQPDRRDRAYPQRPSCAPWRSPAPSAMPGCPTCPRRARRCRSWRASR